MLLGAIQSPAQRELLPQLDALVAVIVGYVDHVMDRSATASSARTAWSPRRCAAGGSTADPSDRFVERLFGLELTQAHYDRGTAFVDGVVERAGDRRASSGCGSPSASCPTPAEIDAPGLWLARIDLPEG